MAVLSGNDRVDQIVSDPHRCRGNRQGLSRPGGLLQLQRYGLGWPPCRTPTSATATPCRRKSRTTASTIAAARSTAIPASTAVGSRRGSGYRVSTAYSVRAPNCPKARRTVQSLGRAETSASRSCVGSTGRCSATRAAFTAFSAACCARKQTWYAAMSWPMSASRRRLARRSRKLLRSQSSTLWRIVSFIEHHSIL